MVVELSYGSRRYNDNEHCTLKWKVVDLHRDIRFWSKFCEARQILALLMPCYAVAEKISFLRKGTQVQWPLDQEQFTLNETGQLLEREWIVALQSVSVCPRSNFF